MIFFCVHYPFFINLHQLLTCTHLCHCAVNAWQQKAVCTRPVARGVWGVRCKSDKRSSFSHKMGQKCGFCRGFKGWLGSKIPIYESKRSTFGGLVPQSILATGLVCTKRFLRAHNQIPVFGLTGSARGWPGALKLPGTAIQQTEKQCVTCVTSKFCVVQTIWFCSNFTSMWSKYLSNDAWRDFGLPMFWFFSIRTVSYNIKYQIRKSI